MQLSFQLTCTIRFNSYLCKWVYINFLICANEFTIFDSRFIRICSGWVYIIHLCKRVFTPYLCKWVFAYLCKWVFLNNNRQCANEFLLLFVQMSFWGLKDSLPFDFFGINTLVMTSYFYPVQSQIDLYPIAYNVSLLTFTNTEPYTIAIKSVWVLQGGL